MSESPHHYSDLPPSTSLSPSQPQPPHSPPAQQYTSPSFLSPTNAQQPTANPDPLVVAHVRKQSRCCFFMRYSNKLPLELTPYMHKDEYAASIRRLNTAFACRSWVLTFLVLSGAFFVSGAFMIGFGVQKEEEDDGYYAPAAPPVNDTSTGLSTRGGANGTYLPSTGSSTYISQGGSEALLKIGIAFTIFAYLFMWFTFKLWQVGKAKELTNALLIENSRYAQRRPVVRFRLLAGGWFAKLMKRAAPLRRWQLQVEVCGGGGGQGEGESNTGSSNQLNSAYTVVNLPHSNVVKLRERMRFPVRAQANGRGVLVDIAEATSPQQPTMPPLQPAASLSVLVVDDRAEADSAEAAGHPQQPPPAYSVSDIEMQPPAAHIQPVLTLAPLPAKPAPLPIPDPVNQSAPDATAAQPAAVEWPAVSKAEGAEGAVVMLSSPAAVVDEGKVREYEQRLQRLVEERAEQDEKMQEMQRELEQMRAQQQPPLVISLTSADGVMRSLPPGSGRQPLQVDGSRLALQAEGSTPGSNVAPLSEGRSGVLLLAGRRFSF